MFILQFLRCRFYLRIDQFTAACHLRHFLKHNCIVNCLMCIFAPCKRSMILAEYCRNSFIIKVFEIICDQYTRILFVCFLNLLFCQITYTWNFSVNIVRMSRTIAWNRSPGLCPARRPFRVCMYDSTDLRKWIIKNHMCWCVWWRIIFTLDFVSIQVNNYHIFRSEFIIFHTTRLDYKQSLFTVNAADITPCKCDQPVFRKIHISFINFFF